MKYHIKKTIDAVRRFPLRIFYVLAGRFYHHDERIAMYLYDYFPSYRAAFGEFANQISRIMRRDRSYAVQGVVIEPTNICNLRCRHCTPQSIQSEKGYMNFGLFKNIVDKNPQLTSMILTRNGEPFLHPNIFEMIEYARSKNIYVNIYTNGTVIDDKAICRIFSSGLNELNFSMEGAGEYYRYNRGKDYALIKTIIQKVLSERSRKASNVKIGINAVITEDGKNLQDVMGQWGGLVDFITVEPLMAAKSSPRNAPCRTLWRNMVIEWDGDVVVCCSDISGQLKVGNVKDNTLREIFNGSGIQELRRRHLKKDFPNICKYCDSHFG